jgi:predicted naringenin-chalcone synthase
MVQDRPQVALLALGTAVPSHRFQQTALGRWMADSLGMQPALSRWIRRLYDLSGIETRYSCLPDPAAPPSMSRFAPGHPPADTPTTSERMAIYQREATAIGTAAAYRALAEYGAGALVAEVAATVTHLIVVSCTGFFAPGLDQAIANRLNFRPTVERTLVGFMGCAAAFNALRLADQIVRAQPSARVLVVCVELCSLHIQSGNNRIDLIVASLFADGAAACLVGAPPMDGRDYVLLDSFYSEVVPDTDQEMVWRIGDHGFTLHLSPDIPRRLGEVAPRALASLLDGRAMPRAWAIHPGGRAIVDRLAELFDLAPEQTEPSLAVLRQYGNMSSSTILFVLRELRERLRCDPTGDTVGGVAMAFGPGLVVEMAHLTYVPRPEVALRRTIDAEMEPSGAYAA